ncbi:hypothetical protein KAW55_01395 [bacterium]|nr:hypothetical protein [bacterium]
MLILVRLIGIVVIGMGIIFLINPKLYKQYIAFWEKGRRLYMGGILGILLGVILLLAASQCRLVGVIVALGIITLAKGILILALGPERMKSMLRWWQGRPLLVLRLLTPIAIAVGALLLYSA